MKTYILKGMDRSDFQLSSQGSMIHEALEAEELERYLRKTHPQAPWQLVSFQELKTQLDHDPHDITVALSRYGLPYKKYLETHYPQITLIEGPAEMTKRQDEKYEIMMLGTILFTLVILLVVGLVS